MTDLRPGRASGDGLMRVGAYEILSKLGEGGMGVVHLARHEETGERVALKVLRTHVVGDEETRARLEREVRSLRQVRSPWIAEIVDADPYADLPYVATRYVPGPTLHDRIKDDGPVVGEDRRT
ncbi:protein kinase, partial [Nocardioides sp. NPDC000441]|uniref:protein kinase domain-containing protein n=1 Tax=Nocardioides sp. NPDC000441 TaxID=3154256 RepID=UPI003321DE60